MKKETSKVRSYVVTALWLIAAGVVLTFITFSPENRKLSIFLIVASFSSLMWIFLWLGNAMASDLIDRRIDWIREPVKRFVVGMLVMVVYTVAVSYGLVWVFKTAFGLNVGDTRTFQYSTLIVTFIISLFMHGRGFLQSWKLAEIEAEKAKQESIKANYESLKNQVNPHFLFNSLNALTSLVYEDQDKAAKFIKQLSEVYRYVLDSRNKEVVTLDEELSFMNSYLFLQQIRFGDKLKIENELKSMKGNVPPLALQMLVENAIKHNEVSQEQPLIIKLHSDGSNLFVSNNLQLKSKQINESVGVGLDNITKRYEFLSDRPVVIEKDEKNFVVKLPILLEEQ
ncbi:MAG: histidine kinase [Cyclobacteriaceae bacterium]